MSFPTPHGDKLRALLDNAKLPTADQPRVEAAIETYDAWINEMTALEGECDDLVEPLVEALNRYKTAVDLDLVFDSPDDFLYRQKGQLKLDNTVIEEFLPWLVGRVFADRIDGQNLILGPTNAFSHLRFESGILDGRPGTGMAVKSKDHDFVLARPLYLKSSHNSDYSQSTEASTRLAYLAAEIKTNLDKTMFQEASATARDLMLAVPNSKYFLLCEWLDMTPIGTSATAIEEVVVLRRAKRLAADVRRDFSTARGRKANRAVLQEHLAQYPLAASLFRRFLDHVDRMLGDAQRSEQEVLSIGWF
ncbi:MAG: Bpu10I family restriction endonuclease [Gammaproteobacteria bacterium]|nr:Bpu10I family restriction endonuclease [Gammaproteobacteria bacterium]